MGDGPSGELIPPLPRYRAYRTVIRSMVRYIWVALASYLVVEADADAVNV